MAGESARDVARRNREKAERLLQVAESYERGAEGEEATARALAALPADTWRVVHDLRWPGRRHANIDHVVVGPGGIFVIDSKHWTGNVEVRDDVLRQNGRTRERAVAAVADSAIAVAELTPGLNPDLVKPVICFVRDEPVSGWARDVMVCSTANVVAMLESRKPVFVQPEVQRQYQRLQHAMTSASPPGRGVTARTPAAGPWVPLPSGIQPPPVPRRRSSLRSRTSAKRGIGSLAVGVLVIAGGFAASRSGLLDEGASRFVESFGTSAVHQGQAVTLPAWQSAPALELTAVRTVRASAVARAQAAKPGQQLWAVRFIVRNQGRTPLRAPWPLAARVVDDHGESRSAEATSTRVRQGSLLPTTRPVAPGRSVAGFLVFRLPRTSTVEEVRLSYGVERARWKVSSTPG